MKRNVEAKIGSLIMGRINAVNMSEIERQMAINAMRDAEVLVDIIVWVATKIERAGAYLFRLIPKPSLKH